jgi:hypothetical protein
LKCNNVNDTKSNQTWTKGLDSSNNTTCLYYPYPNETRYYNTQNCTGPYTLTPP